MSDHTISLLLLAVAGIALPVGYLFACGRLKKQKAWWFTYVAYFVIFGTVGGWVFAFAMSPSGLTASSTVFLVTVALFACIVSAIVLTFRKGNSRAEWIAVISGYLYPVCLGIMLTVAFLIDRALNE